MSTSKSKTLQSYLKKRNVTLILVLGLLTLAFVGGWYVKNLMYYEEVRGYKEEFAFLKQRFTNLQKLLKGKKQKEPPEPTPPTTSNDTVIDGSYIHYNNNVYQPITTIKSPYEPYVLVLATDPVEYWATWCGSIYTPPTCYFFLEPEEKEFRASESGLKFIAQLERPGGIVNESIRFTDAHTISFISNDGDAGNGFNIVWKLNLNTREAVEMVREKIDPFNHVIYWQGISFTNPAGFSINRIPKTYDYLLKQPEHYLVLSNLPKEEIERVDRYNDSLFQEQAGRETESFREGNMVTLEMIPIEDTLGATIEQHMAKTAYHFYGRKPSPKIYTSKNGYEVMLYSNVDALNAMMEDFAYIKIPVSENDVKLISIALDYASGSEKDIAALDTIIDSLVLSSEK